MKHTITSILLCLLAINTYATDLFVRENGAGGAYATISDAITAAADGDRIIITPKVGDIPYVEDLTINKSLTLQSSNIGEKYLVFGTISIVPAAERIVIIHNAAVSEDVEASSNSGSGERTVVSIFNSEMEEVFFDRNNVTVNLISNEIGGVVYFRHGKLIGNDMFGEFQIENDVNSSTLADTPIYIIGNKITFENYNQSNFLASETYAYHIYNNDFNSIYLGGSNPFALLEIFFSGENSLNFIHNNDFSFLDEDEIVNGIYIQGTNNVCVWDIRNNSFSITGVGTTTNVWDDSSDVNSQAYFNKYKAGAEFLVDIEASNTEFTTDADLVDAGHPATTYYDIDLTPNDVGIHGGSHAWSNYHPEDSDGKPQVYFLEIPNLIINSSTIDVKAAAFSK
ncbi:hypothetical protein GCM10022393_02670 [Aquimarina addita]|uniref:Right handed beta helix domain-containing protein n=1 Tax=Aquimarina addita TaxID=870485 RepID=A0ABP7X8P3_9FLAO